MIKNTKEIELKCKRCNNRTWKYHGNSQYYASCPKCRSSISIRKNKVEAKFTGYPPRINLNNLSKAIYQI